MLNISKIYEWTLEETAKVFASRIYQGMGEWSSGHVKEWFGEQEVNEMALRLAEHYISKHTKMS